MQRRFAPSLHSSTLARSAFRFVNRVVSDTARVRSKSAAHAITTDVSSVQPLPFLVAARSIHHGATTTTTTTLNTSKPMQLFSFSSGGSRQIANRIFARMFATTTTTTGNPPDLNAGGKNVVVGQQSTTETPIDHQPEQRQQQEQQRQYKQDEEAEAQDRFEEEQKRKMQQRKPQYLKPSTMKIIAALFALMLWGFTMSHIDFSIFNPEVLKFYTDLAENGNNRATLECYSLYLQIATIAFTTAITISIIFF